MKGSLFLAATGAALAMAGPIGLEKRAMETKWVDKIVTVTVTAGNDAGAMFIEQSTSTSSSKTVVPEPEPTTAPPPPPPAPEPTTSTSTTKKAKPSSKKQKIIPLPSIKPIPEPKPEPKPQPKPQPKPSTTKPKPKPEPSPEPEQPSGSNDYQTALLKQHNVHRSNHSAPALTWDDELASWAANTAKGCVFEHDMNQGSGNYGQNLASFGGSSGMQDSAKTKTAESGVSDWYNTEFSNFDGLYGEANPSGNFEGYGHFTQMLWKDTEQVGCATVKCPADSVLSYESFYTVCNYKPAGNMGGAYNTNVLQPKGEAIVAVSA